MAQATPITINELERLVKLARKEECARIDACTCQTKQDWRNYHEATDAFEDFYGQLRDRLQELDLR